MAHPNILDPARTALLVIDVQEAFRSAVPDFALATSLISIAVRGAAILGIPVLVTEQYPIGLGRTAEEIQLALPENFDLFEKTAFSSCGAEPLVARLNELGIQHIAICGLEAHICVNQTAHDLLDRGYMVHILEDCICARSDRDKATGIEKMRRSGAIPSTMEMAVFELMRDSRHEKFKEIQALIR
jgi:nicotinamidase-related amidase